MAPGRRLALAVSGPLSLALIVAAAALLSQSSDFSPLAAPPPQFEAGRAAAQRAAWAARFPARPVGSAASAAFRQALLAELAGLGLTVETQPFSVTVASEARAGVNVLAYAGGAPREPGLLLAASCDSRQSGGADGLAAAAALAELARVLSAHEGPGAPIIFLFADSGEYGRAAGVQAYLEALPAAGRPRPLAVLALAVRAGPSDGPLSMDGIGYLAGAAPVWLRQAGLEAARQAGAEAAEPQGLAEALARALPFEQAGPGRWLAAGVPALGLAGPDSPDGRRDLGRTAEVLARGLAAQAGRLPTDGVDAWRLDESRSLPGWAARLVALLAFLPLFSAAGLAVHDERPGRAPLQLELAAWAGAALPALNGFAAGFILMRLGLLPGYGQYPAAPGDPFLLQPTDWAMLLILSVVGLSAWDIWRPGGWGSLADRLPVPGRRAALLLAFSAVALAAWLLNGYAAALLLAPAGWLWPWIQPSHRPAGRALNALLAAGGLLPFTAVVAALAMVPGLGLPWWFLTAAAIYGLVPLTAVAAFSAGAGLFVRFLRLGMPEPA